MIKIITDFLDETAKRLPDKKAYIEPENDITFSRIAKLSRACACGIAGRGLFHAPIAIFLEKSILCIEAMYAVCYSGNYYTVLDTAMPASRIEKILESLKPAAVITDKKSVDSISADTEVLLMEELLEEAADDALLKSIRDNMQSTDLMYVLFTSGSTGVPKGVTTSHLAYIQYLEGAGEVYELEENDRFLSQVPFYFVMAGTDIYAPRMHPAYRPRKLLRFSGAFNEIHFRKRDKLSLLGTVRARNGRKHEGLRDRRHFLCKENRLRR